MVNQVRRILEFEISLGQLLPRRPIWPVADKIQTILTLFWENELKFPPSYPSNPFLGIERLAFIQNQIRTRECLESLDLCTKCDLKAENLLIKSYSMCFIDRGSGCFETTYCCCMYNIDLIELLKSSLVFHMTKRLIFGLLVVSWLN